MKNIFLTGEMQIGKSTLIKKVIDTLNISIGGFNTSRNITDTSKEFYAKSLNNKNLEYKLATIVLNDIETKVFPYTGSFEELANTIIRKSINDSDIIILDELGFLESKACDFQRSVFEALDSNKIVLGVLKARDIPFLNKIKERKDVIVIEVTKDNRDFLLPDILALINK